MMINREYKTLGDLVQPVIGSGSNTQDLLLGKPVIISGSLLINSLIHYYFEDSSVTITDQYINQLFCTYIYPTYHNVCICYKDNGDSDFTLEYQLFISKLMRRINATKDEYEKLISLYDSIKNNLLDGIKSKQKVKFNDTPQTVSGTYDDSYISNLTDTESEFDGASKIARIKEIEDNIVDYMQKWANEVCKGVFMYD